MTVMPQDFFGGKDPVVHYQKVSPPSGVVSRAAPGGPAALPGTKPRAPHASFFAAHKGLAITLISIVSVAVVAAISWYYISEARRAGLRTVAPPPQETPEAPLPPPPSDTVPTTTAAIATSTPIETPIETPPSLGDLPLQFPRTVFADTSDLDGDALTDMEEEVFGTDSGIYDSDGDGYYDGQEVVNLYNPRGVAPIKIIDSGLVLEYSNPTWQYRVYYPVGWEVGAVDANAHQVLVSSVNGDYIEIQAVQTRPSESFDAWFGRMAIGEDFSALVSFTNRFQEEGYRRRDGLVAYYPMDGVVYVVLYHPKSGSVTPFRHIMDMVTQSFRPSRFAPEIPDQEPLPPVPTPL